MTEQIIRSLVVLTLFATGVAVVLTTAGVVVAVGLGWLIGGGE